MLFRTESFGPEANVSVARRRCRYGSDSRHSPAGHERPGTLKGQSENRGRATARNATAYEAQVQNRDLLPGSASDTSARTREDWKPS